MKAIAQLSNDTRVIYNHLSSSKIGDLITYEDLSNLVGYDITTKRSILASARRKCMNSDNIVFGVVIGEGIKRLSDSEIVSEASRAPSRMRNVARKGTRIASNVKDFDSMSDDDKRRHNATMSLCGVISQMTKPSTIKRVEQSIEPARAIGTEETLRMFAGLRSE